MKKPAENPVGDRPEGDEKAPRTHPGQGPYKHRGAVRRRAVQRGVLEFLANTDVGRTSGPPAAGEEDGEDIEASEWEERERAERLAEQRAEEERLGRSSDWAGGVFLMLSLSLIFLRALITLQVAVGG